MFRTYLIAGYYASTALCAPQYSTLTAASVDSAVISLEDVVPAVDIPMVGNSPPTNEIASITPEDTNPEVLTVFVTPTLTVTFTPTSDINLASSSSSTSYTPITYSEETLTSPSATSSTAISTLPSTASSPLASAAISPPVPAAISPSVSSPSPPPLPFYLSSTTSITSSNSLGQTVTPSPLLPDTPSTSLSPLLSLPPATVQSPVTAPSKSSSPPLISSSAALKPGPGTTPSPIKPTSELKCGKLPYYMGPTWTPYFGFYVPPGTASDCLYQWLSTRSSVAPKATSVPAQPTTGKAPVPSTLSSLPRLPTQWPSSASAGIPSPSMPPSPEHSPQVSGDAKLAWNPHISNQKLGPTFQIILSGVPDLKSDAKNMVPEVDIYDIDLFRTEKKTIDKMRALNKTVICYFSGGTFEPNRPDSSQFAYRDKGLRLAQWPQEMWVRTGSASIRQIMTARIQLAQQKGCDAIDPDNIDAYGSGAGGGLGLTRRDTISFIQFLSSTAAKYKLGVGLKNGLEILPDVKHLVHFAVNEECVKANECDRYKDFLIKDNKPVFHIEYPSNDRARVLDAPARNKWCGEKSNPAVRSSINFQTVIKQMNLGGWVLYCNGSHATTPVHEAAGGGRWSSGGERNTAIAEEELPKMSEYEASVAEQDGYPFDLSKIEVLTDEEVEAFDRRMKDKR